jgi:hypothetical protein
MFLEWSCKPVTHKAVKHKHTDAVGNEISLWEKHKHVEERHRGTDNVLVHWLRHHDCQWSVHSHVTRVLYHSASATNKGVKRKVYICVCVGAEPFACISAAGGGAAAVRGGRVDFG